MKSVFIGIIGAATGAILTFLLNLLREKRKDKLLHSTKQKERLLKNIYAPLSNLFELYAMVDKNHEEKLIELALREIKNRKLPIFWWWRKRKLSNIAINEIAPKLVKSGLPLQGQVICPDFLYNKVVDIIGQNLDVCDEPLRGMYVHLVTNINFSIILPKAFANLEHEESFKSQVPKEKRKSIIEDMSNSVQKETLGESNKYLYRIYVRTEEMYYLLRKELGYPTPIKY